MKTISGYYNHFCSPKYQPLGFSRHKSIFVRMTGDILQVFSFRHSRTTFACYVEFGLFPLCLPQPVFLDAGGYSLDEFVVEPHEGSSRWIYDSNSEESMTNCVESISKALDLYLIPFFEICHDCKSALPGLIKLEELFDCNRQKRLHLRGEYDSAVPWQERSFFDYRKYYMALKSRNLTYAKQYLNHQVNYYKTRLQAFDNHNSPNQPAIVKERFRNTLALYLKHLEWLDSGDFSYFDDLLNYNKNQMLAYLTDKYPKVSNTGGFEKSF